MTDQLADVIRKAMLEDGIRGINLFINKNGGFQANTGRGEGAYTVKQSECPVKALIAAIKAAPAPRKLTSDEANEFEDVLG